MAFLDVISFPSTKYSVLSTQYCIRWAFAAVLMAVLTGCDPASNQPTASEAPNSKSGVTLVRADGAVLEKTITKHKGKVVFVDMWATWCLPCVEGFPHTVELAKKHREAGLATIAVSFDQLEDEAKVQSFLKEQGADFDNFISKYNGVSQQAAVDFDVEALPQYRLYDRQGKLRKKWEGTPDDLEQMIETLLAEQA
jgi:thiol-disulfide isomerase/thioredoxin